MTKSVAKEYGKRNITCNAVAPGLIRTPMTDVLSDELKAKMLDAVALKRYGEPEEIASVVSFLVSENASYITGQVIEISGGLSM
jgi:3-oxoacyl-[acyl-carrier protein] reductase